MTKTELTKDLKSFVGGGGIITQQQLIAYLGYSPSSRNSITWITKQLQQVGNGYFIPDIVDIIIK